MQNDERTEILLELLAWTKIGFYGTAKSMLKDVLDTDSKRAAYQLTDGQNTNEMIRTQAQIGSNTLNDLFKHCLNLGLMEKDKDGRRRRLFDLANFGLMPEVEVVKAESAAGGK